MKRRQPQPGDSHQSSSSSWSPHELCPYNFRQRTSLRRKRSKMSHDRADWDTNLTRTFLRMCIDEKEKLNFSSNKTLTKEGWRNVIQKFRQETGKYYTSRQMQNKFTALKRQHKANQEAGRSQNKPYQHELDILFGGPDTQDGNLLCIGGVGYRTPSGAGGATFAQSPAANARSCCHVCHRAGNEHEVDSPPARRSLDYYLQRLSSSLDERSKTESMMLRRHEKRENQVKRLLQTVRDDGVEIGTELYLKATELFRDETRRVAFETFLTPEQRINYLNWAWEQSTRK